MADYRLNGPDDSNGVIYTPTNKFIPNAPGNRDWSEYVVWAQTNTADPQYTLAEAKIIASNNVRAMCDAALEQPINDGTDDIIATGLGRGKILGAKGSGKPSMIVQKTDGRSKTLTVPQMNTLISDLDDRDDALLSDLETDLDAIDAATTLSELDPYMP